MMARYGHREGYEPIVGAEDVAVRAARTVAGAVLLLCVSVGLFSSGAAPREYLWGEGASLDSTVDFATFLEVLKAQTPSTNASQWRIGKVAHAVHASSGSQVQAFLNDYVCSEAGDCASDLGCGALRAMCSVRVPWRSADADDDDDDAVDSGLRAAVNTGSSTAGLHFVDAPRLNDLRYPNATSPKGVDYWVGYMEAAHGDWTTFDAWMHSKLQLYATNLSRFVDPLREAGVARLERTSRDVDGVRVAHVGFNVAGRVLELVGPAASLGARWDAPAWSADECAAAHALVSSVRALDAAGGAAVDDATAFDAGQGLSLVGVGVLAADPTAPSARPLYESLRAVTAADVTLVPAAPDCDVVEAAWPSMPHAALRFVRNGAAATGPRAPGDMERYVQAAHDAFLAGARRGSWDRWLDNHVGLWYDGGAAKCDALVQDLHADLDAAGVVYAQRQQADALLVYAAFGFGAGPMAVEYQFAACTSDAPAECACDASNNNDLFEAATGDSCWADGDDWCLE